MQFDLNYVNEGHSIPNNNDTQKTVLDIPYLPVIPERLVKEHNLNIGPLTIIKDKQKFEHHLFRSYDKNNNKTTGAIKSGLLINDKLINRACKLNRFKKLSSVDKCNNTKLPDIDN
jgi:hypothetical protein